MSEVTVEAGTVSMADAVAELWVALAEDQRAYGSHLRGPENETVARDAIARHAVTGGLRVATVDDRVVGFVTFSLEDGEYEQTVARGLVHDLYVAPAFRDEGVGSRLLAAAEAALAREGVDRVSLEAMADNADARRFYERHGYDLHRVELEKSVGTDTDSR